VVAGLCGASPHSWRPDQLSWRRCPGAKQQHVTNDGSVSTSLINGYGIWAGDPSNSTSTTAGFGDTLRNNGCIATTGPNAISLFARSFNKTTGDTLINRRSAEAGPHWWQVAAPLRLGERWS
jgi:hypothetical protein